MCAKEVAFPGGKKSELHLWKAEVLSVMRDNETRVHGSGGGGHGRGRIDPIAIRSSVIEHYRVWLRFEPHGKEEEINFGGWGLTCREGHRLSVVVAGRPDSAGKRSIVCIKNQSTGTTHFAPDMILLMRKLGLISDQQKIGKFSFLSLWGLSYLAFSWAVSKAHTETPWFFWWGIGLIMLPIIPGFLWVAINYYLGVWWEQSTVPVLSTLKREAVDMLECL